MIKHLTHVWSKSAYATVPLKAPLLNGPSAHEKNWETTQVYIQRLNALKILDGPDNAAVALSSCGRWYTAVSTIR